MIDDTLITSDSHNANRDVALEESNEESLQSKYLRWSVPSLVLAVVTAILWFCSVVWTEPSIPEKYRQLSKRNLEKLKLIEPSFWVSEKVTGDASKSLSMIEERRLLDETTLALRRLVIRNTRDDWAHYQLGMVAAASARWYQQAGDGNADADAKTRESWRGEIISAEKRARDEMSIVIGLGGEYSKNAVRWSLWDELRDLCFVTTENKEQVEKLNNLLNELMTKEVDANTFLELRSWQAKLSVLNALSLSSNVSVDERRKMLNDARDVFAVNKQPSLECLSWHADSMVISCQSGAIDKAREAVQMYFTTEEELAKSPFAIASTFKNLLLVGAMSEAENLVVKSISGSVPARSLLLRDLASAAAFRQLINVSLASQASETKSNLVRLYGISFRLSPNAAWIIESVKELVSESDKTGLWMNLEDELLGGDDPGVSSIIQILKSIRSSETANVEEELDKLRSIELGLLPGFASMVVNLVDKEVLSEEAGGNLLRTMSETSREQMSVWYARVAFCSKFQRVAEEVECLEFISTKVSNGEQLLERLQLLREIIGANNK